MIIEKVSNYAQQLFDIKTLFEHLLTSAGKTLLEHCLILLQNVD